MIQYTPQQVLESVSRLLVRLAQAVEDDYLSSQATSAAELLANLVCHIESAETAYCDSKVDRLISAIDKQADNKKVAAALAATQVADGSCDALAEILRRVAEPDGITADSKIIRQARDLASLQLDEALALLRRAPEI